MKRPCPQCQQATVVTADNPYRPFCCERCKLLDLGDWLAERNRIESAEPAMDESNIHHDDWQH